MDSTPTAITLLADRDCATLLELDRAAGSSKGAAFRAFKALAAQWVEGEHFHCCDSRTDPDGFALVSASGRLYPGTVNALFLRPSAQALVLARLRGGGN